MKKFLSAVILSGLIILPAVFSGCASQVVARPKDATPLPVVQWQEADLARVSHDYQGNPALAESSYQGKRLFFSGVRVEGVSSTNGNYYFAAGNLRFRPGCIGDLGYLSEGTVVNVAGDCQGLLWNYVYFNDCWIQVVSGGLGAPRSGY